MGCFLELDRRSHDFCETDSTLAHGTLGASGIRAAGKGRLIRVHRNVCIGWKAAGPSMLGIGCPDRHALPRITLSNRSADPRSRRDLRDGSATGSRGRACKAYEEPRDPFIIEP
jgi:hypothetical protein